MKLQEKNCGTYAEKICKHAKTTHPPHFRKCLQIFSSNVQSSTQFLIIFADFLQYRAITHPIFGVFAGIMFSFFYQQSPPPTPIPFLLKTLIFQLGPSTASPTPPPHPQPYSIPLLYTMAYYKHTASHYAF